jgi:redox-sensitive bicupin YhaK (pirin superfamily)
MTAGRGVIHAEMPDDEVMKNGGTVEGFQLWVNLPKKDKMINPRYQDTPSAKIPEVLVPSPTDSKVLDAVRTRVIAGESQGKSAVIETRTPILYLDIQLNEKGVEYETAVPSQYNGM